MKLYAHPTCSKSNALKQLLTEKGYNFTLVNYLELGLNEELINQLLKKSNLRIDDLLRTKEVLYQENYKMVMTDQEKISLLIKHPILLERPILETKTSAIVARPIEKALEIL